MLLFHSRRFLGTIVLSFALAFLSTPRTSQATPSGATVAASGVFKTVGGIVVAGGAVGVGFLAWMVTRNLALSPLVVYAVPGALGAVAAYSVYQGIRLLYAASTGRLEGITDADCL